MQFFQGGAGVNGVGGYLGGGAEVWREAGHDQSGGGVGDDDIVGRAGFTLENAADNGGVVVSVATLQRFERRAVQAKIFGSDGKTANFAVAHFGDLCLAGERDFIEAAGAVENESAFDAEIGEGSGDEIDQVSGENAKDLGLCGGGIGERAEKIEDGAVGDQVARGRGMFGSGMSGGGEEEADADFADGFAGVEKGMIDIDAEGFENVGRTGEGSGGAIAVFGYAGARRGSDYGGGGGDVEGAAGVATGAAGVDHVFRARISGQKDGSGVAAHDGSEGRKLRWGDCAAIERSEQTNDVWRFDAAGEQLFHQQFRFGARKGITGFDALDQRNCSGHQLSLR